MNILCVPFSGVIEMCTLLYTNELVTLLVWSKTTFVETFRYELMKSVGLNFVSLNEVLRQTSPHVT